MADILITDLPVKTNLLQTDLMPVDDGTSTYKVTGAQMRNFLRVEFLDVLQPSEGNVFNLKDYAVHDVTINAAASLVPPAVDPAGNEHHEIKLFLHVSGTPVINWGTTHFFGGTAPYIKQGHYVVYYDYVPNLNAWVVGALEVV